VVRGLVMPISHEQSAPTLTTIRVPYVEVMS